MPAILAITLFGFLVASSCSTSSTRSSDGCGPNSFLDPYVQQLEFETSAAGLKQLARSSRSDLSLFHHGYGTSIRNRWIHGGRDPNLVKYLTCKGYRHADDMSQVLIEKLWEHLNHKMSAQEKREVEALREVVAKRNATYGLIASECTERMSANKNHFDTCIEKYGRPSSNKTSADPFHTIKISRHGEVFDIEHLTGGSLTVRSCIEAVLNKLRFSKFSTPDFVEVYISNYPSCLVNQE